MKKLILISLLISIFSPSLSSQTPRVKPGVEVLREAAFTPLKGKRVGLITNPTGVDNSLESTIDILAEAPEVELTALFAPEHGVSLYGTRHLLFSIAGRYTVTWEQLLYQANVALKYTATIPLILIFVASTHPTELAASLNRIGLSYKVSYAVSLALRYIPDTISEFFAVSKCQQARGVEMTNKESMVNRIKAAAQIVLPLILSSIDRIETVSNAMELRKFGTQPKRTWITGGHFRRDDYIAVGIGVAMMAYAVFFLVTNGGRYWNPFL